VRSKQLDADVHWLFMRMHALMCMHAGDRARGIQLLASLAQSERSGRAFASELLCMADACLLFNDSSDRSQLAHEVSLAPLTGDPDDPPNIWALKVRALSAFDRTAEARRLLAEVPASELVALPRDRDYLGTLGALTRAAMSLDARQYLEALEPLLGPYQDRFSVNIAFYCEGSMLQLGGLIAARLGRAAEACEKLTAAIELSDRTGLSACAAQARLELALCRAHGKL